MKNKIALFLALVLSLSSAAMTACGNTADETTADTAETVDAAETEDNPYAGYDFQGKSLRVYSSNDSSDSTNAHFLIAGSGETNGEIVNDAVYNRNLKVEEGLKIKLEYTECDWDYTNILEGIDQLVLAGDSVYDVLVNDVFRLVESSVKGQLHNVAKTDKLNLDAGYWYTGAMKDLEIVPGAMYLMMGDYFADSLASAHVLYYNKDVILDNYADANYLHDIIMEGKFTKDVMLEIMETCSVDLDGNGVWDKNDRMGYIVHGYWGPMMPVVTGFSVQYIERDDKGNVSFCFNNERSVEVITACNELFHNERSLKGLEGNLQETIHNLMANGQGVFAGYLRLSDFGKMRDYETTIGLSPYPKLNEAQESYVASLHDTSEVGAVLLTTPVDDLDFVFTCLEFLTMEASEMVIPVWFDEALKVKYSSGTEDAVILDLIRSSVDKPFALAYQSALGSYPLPACFLNLINKNSNDFASNFQSTKDAGEAALASVVAAFQSNLEHGN
ncbi:MAG: hypothetical protein IKY52_07875 [Clostridia bacterium]|nr:hypothetical protein [Clostridia bacterium]